MELERDIRQILTETCRGEIHAATAGILSLISAARQQETVISDEVVERMCRARTEALRNRATYVDAMRAALSLLPRGEAPDGYVLVPVEPTEGMLVNGREALLPLVRTNAYGPILAVWKDMLSAAPSPTTHGRRE